MATPQPALVPEADPLHLTPAQRRFLQCMSEQPQDSVAHICQSANVSTRSYYAWCQDPEFRDLTTRIWSQAFLSNGWQIMNRIVNLIGTSPSYARIVVQLLFDAKGQAALSGWSQLNQIPEPGAGLPTPPPGRVAKFLSKTIAQASKPEKKPPTPVQTPVEQNQQLTTENFLIPEPAPEPVPAPAPESEPSAPDVPSYASIVESLREMNRAIELRRNPSLANSQ